MLYQRNDLSYLGRPLPTHGVPFQKDEGVLTEAEVEAAFRWMKQNKDVGHTHLRDKQLQGFLREAYPVRESTPHNLA